MWMICGLFNKLRSLKTGMEYDRNLILVGSDRSIMAINDRAIPKKFSRDLHGRSHDPSTIEEIPAGCRIIFDRTGNT